MDEIAFEQAMRNFSNEVVVAVGGKLVALSEKRNIITFYQKVEYLKSFNIWRSLFNSLNANCLISGAFGIFRKLDLLLVGSYDTSTVGEDLEVVLSLQEYLRGLGRKVLYENSSVCYTEVPMHYAKFTSSKRSMAERTFG